MSTLQPLAIQKDVKIRLNCPKNLVFDFDHEDLEIVLNNILSNAVKYNKQGGTVDCNIIETDEAIEISVSDTGIGIEKEDHFRIFNEFVRVKNENTKKIAGSGLGLSIVKKILEHYNAVTSVESEIGTGTTVKIRIIKN
jgi:signal transduction histidine kinase